MFSKKGVFGGLGLLAKPGASLNDRENELVRQRGAHPLSLILTKFRHPR